MGVMPGYKQTNVGVIPNDWQAATISEVSEKVTVGFVGSMAHLFRNDGVPLLRGQNVLPGRLDLSDTRFISTETHKQWSKSALRAGDVVLVRVGYPGTACVIPPELGEANAASLVVVRPKDESLSAPFLVSVANSEFGKRQMESYLVGGAQQVLNIGTAAKFNLPLPPRAEQETIAEALSDADALIESLEQLLAKKRQIKQGAMQELLTGKHRLPGFSGDWVAKRLGSLCDIAMGRTPSRLDAASWGAGYKWLSIADLKSKVVSESKEEITPFAAASMQVIREGTLLMSFKLSIGRLCFAGCDLYTNEAICSFNNLKANASFLYYILGRTDFSLYGKQAVKGYTLNKESLQSVEVRLPPIEEQTAIATLLSDMDTELAALETKLSKARQLKRGMMQELLTGRIRLV